MTTMARPLVALALVAPIALFAGDRAPETGPDPFPAPTERAESHSERDLEEGRRAWMREMHRSAPGTDWRALERSNGLALQARRGRELADSRGAPAAIAWNEIGSRNLAGRMHCAALAAGGDSLYGGSSRGGIWKADLEGKGWRPLSDNLWGGAHGLAVAVGPPETMTRITDDGLIHYSEDGGGSWHEPTGPLANITECVRVAGDAADPNRVYFLANKSGLRRLYLSEDRGLSYTRVRNLTGWPGDFWIDRRAGGRIWLLEGSDFYASDDQGQTWNLVGSPGVANPTDVVLAGSEAGGPVFYAALRTGGSWNLHRSTDGGATWAWRHAITDFWKTLEASITDPELLMWGGVELWRSTDGGGSFSLVNNWWQYYDDPLNKLHADLPGLNALWIPPGQEAHFIATDGGLYRSDDGVATVKNVSLEYLGVSQYYTTHTTVNDPDLIVAGAQDQGYQRSTGPAIGTWRDFDQLISGDYGHLTSGDGTHNWLFSVYPGFVLVQQNEQPAFLVAQLDFPAGSSHSWMPYILADPIAPDDFWFCGDRLYRYTKNVNTTWSITASAQDFTAAGGAYLTALAISPVDPDDRLAVTNTGRLWWSSDAGATWNLSAATGPSAHYFYGTALEFSPTLGGEAWVGGSGYSGAGTYRTTDGGATWTAAGAGLPPTLVYDLAYEGGSSAVVYAATEAGPYRFDPGTETWSYVGGTEAPLTTYWCVEAVPAAGVMRFGTYGRGIWDYTIGAATSASLPGGPAAGLRLANRPNPFSASGGTSLHFTLTRPGPLRLVIHDVTGRRVRTLADRFATAGVHEIRWDGRDDQGALVASGVYAARLEAPDGVSTRRMTFLR